MSQPETQSAIQQIVETQRAIVQGERAIFDAWDRMQTPPPQLVEYLIQQQRAASAERLTKNSSYLLRLTGMAVPDDEIARAESRQRRILADQAQARSALGIGA